MAHLPAVVCYLITPQVNIWVWEVSGSLPQKAPDEAKRLIAGGVDGAQLAARLPAAAVVALRQQPRVALSPASCVACSQQKWAGGSARCSTNALEG
jgi:hypothetical protein